MNNINDYLSRNQFNWGTKKHSLEWYTTYQRSHYKFLLKLVKFKLILRLKLPKNCINSSYWSYPLQELGRPSRSTGIILRKKS